MYTVTYVRWLVHFFVNHNLNDDVLVLVVTFTRVEESVNREGSSDIEVYPSRCVQQFKPWTMIKPIYSPDPLRSTIIRGQSNVGFSLA